MECSTIVCTISKPKEVFEIIEDEKFYRVDLGFKDDKLPYPAVISEYIYKGEGKHRVVAYVKSQEVNGKLFTYVNIINAVATDEDYNNLWNVTGMLKRKYDMRVINSSGKEILQFMILYKSYDGHRSVAHCAAKGANARLVNSLKEEDNITFTAFLKENYTALEFCVVDIKRESKAEKGEE